MVAVVVLSACFVQEVTGALLRAAPKDNKEEVVKKADAELKEHSSMEDKKDEEKQHLVVDKENDKKADTKEKKQDKADKVEDKKEDQTEAKAQKRKDEKEDTKEIKVEKKEEKNEDKNKAKFDELEGKKEEKKEDEKEVKVEKKEEKKKNKNEAKIEKKTEKQEVLAANAALKSLLKSALGRPISTFRGQKNPFETKSFKAAVKVALERLPDETAARVRVSIAKASASFDRAAAVNAKVAAELAARKKTKKAHDEALEKMSETNGAPSQGFNEYSDKTVVEHDSGVTMTSDWQKEWPRTHESEEAAQRRICHTSPSKWCKDRGYA